MQFTQNAIALPDLGRGAIRVISHAINTVISPSITPQAISNCGLQVRSQCFTVNAPHQSLTALSKSLEDFNHLFQAFIVVWMVEFDIGDYTNLRGKLR